MDTLHTSLIHLKHNLVKYCEMDKCVNMLYRFLYDCQWGC